MMVGTRATKMKGIKHLMTLARFSEEQMTYVIDACEEPNELVVMNNYGGIEVQYNDEVKLLLVKHVMLKEIAAFAEIWCMKN